MMLASRGALLGAGVAGRNTVRSSRRLISTTTWPSSRSAVRIPSSSFPSSSILNHTSPSWRSTSRTLAVPSIFLVSQSQARLASTSTSTFTAKPASSSPSDLIDDAAISATIPSTTSAFDLPTLGETYLTAIPEHIGYLKEIGLDYGWGVTSTIEFILEHVHISAGLPWWASIIVTSVAFRVLMSPLLKRASDMTARQQAMVPLTKPLSDKMMAHLKASEHQEMQRCREELKVINKRAGIKLSHIFAPQLLTAVIGFCAFRLTRAMATLPVPGLENGGALWFVDLTHPDPYYALSAVAAYFIHLGIKQAQVSGGPVMHPAMQKFMLYGMPALAFTFTAFQPSVYVLWMATASLGTTLQLAMFRQPAVRQALNMAPIVDPRAISSDALKTIEVKARSRPYPGKGLKYQPPTPQSDSSMPVQNKDFVTRQKESFYKSVNSFSEGWSELKKDSLDKAQLWTGQSGKNNIRTSKTQSEDRMKKAAAYEAKWKELNEQKKR